MRLMTSAAIPLGRLVRPFRILPCLERLVAGKTEIGAFREEKLGDLRFMRIVTLGALTGFERRVAAYAGLVLFLESLVTLEAKDILFLYDHTGHGAGVNLMAGQTLSLGERCV